MATQKTKRKDSPLVATLKRAMKAKSLDYKQLAEQALLHPSAVHRILSGESLPLLRTLALISSVLGLDLNEMVGVAAKAGKGRKR